LDNAECNSAVFIKKGFSGTLKPKPSALTRRVSALSVRSKYRDDHYALPNADRSHHIFAPYFGGADGRTALQLVLQLAQNPAITATIVRYQHDGESSQTQQAVVVTKGVQDRTSMHRTVSASNREDDVTFFASLQRSLDTDVGSRVVFETLISSSVIDDALTKAQSEVGQNPKNGGDIVILGRNRDLSQTSSSLGLVANAMLEHGVRASLLVVQAGRNYNLE